MHSDAHCESFPTAQPDPFAITLPDGIAPSLLSAAALLAENWPLGALLGREHIRDRVPEPPDTPLGRLGVTGWCSGLQRVVVFHESGWCLKVPMQDDGAAANRHEVEMLASLAPEDRDFFAETFELPGDLLLQRCYDVDAARFERFERESIEIVRVQMRLRVPDIHAYNVGWTAEGRWLFIDWAGAPARRP